MKRIVMTMIVLSVALLPLAAMGPVNGNTGIDPGELAGVVSDPSLPYYEMSFEDQLKVQEFISVKRQEQRFIHHAAGASALIPGSGQFLTGNYGIGAAFLAADLGIAAGTLAGLYFVLPEELRYLSRDERKEAMKTLDTTEHLAVMGIMAGGASLAVINRIWASNNAENAAREAVESGEVTFDPYVFAVGTRPGIGVKFGMR